MTIRPATPADIPAAVALERASPTAAHWSDAEYRLVFDPGATPRLLLVAEEAGAEGAGAPHIAPDDTSPHTDLARDVWELLGFIIARTAGPEWEIENVAVSPDARRQGLGTQLVSAVIADARSGRAEAIFLEVRASNAAARRLYAHAGFVEIGHRPAYYSNPVEDAILYRLHLRDALPSAP